MVDYLVPSMLDCQSSIFDWHQHKESENLIGGCLRKGEAGYTGLDR